MNPVAGAGACTCSASSCNITAAPSCSVGTLKTTYDSSGTASCNQTGVNLDANGGACKKLDGTFGQHTGISAPQPSGAGSCTAPAVANPAAVTSTPVRVCRTASCAALCDPGLAPGLERCLLASGDQSCPSEAPTKHLIGAKATAGCGMCASCSVTAASCGGDTVFYSDDACATVVRTFTSGVCGAGNASYKSYKWTGKANGVQCTPSGPPAPTAAVLEGQSTICCK